MTLLVVAGIDPGLQGGLATCAVRLGCGLSTERALIESHRTPILPERVQGVSRYDVPRMNLLLNPPAPVLAPHIVYLERVHAMPHEGVVSAFTFGLGLGLWWALAVAAGWMVKFVTPQAWKGHYGLLKQEKDEARRLAIELFPTAAPDLAHKADIGRAEAILIAAYGAHHELPEAQRASA